MDDNNEAPARARRCTLRTLVAAAAAVGTVITFAVIPAGATEGEGMYSAEYASATWTKKYRNTEVVITPGEIVDRQSTTETLEVEVAQHYCSGQILVELDLTGAAGAGDLEGVSVDALDGKAWVEQDVELVGDITYTPAGKKCENPMWDLSVTGPLEVSGTVGVEYKNLRGSRPQVYSGADCGGNGVCYYRDAVARGWISAPFIGEHSLGQVQTGWFYQGEWFVGGEEPEAVGASAEQPLP